MLEEWIFVAFDTDEPIDYYGGVASPFGRHIQFFQHNIDVPTAIFYRKADIAEIISLVRFAISHDVVIVFFHSSHFEQLSKIMMQKYRISLHRKAVSLSKQFQYKDFINAYSNTRDFQIGSIQGYSVQDSRNLHGDSYGVGLGFEASKADLARSEVETLEFQRSLLAGQLETTVDPKGIASIQDEIQALDQKIAEIKSDTKVSFTLYSPREVSRDKHQYGILIYAHELDAIEAMIKDSNRFLAEMGGQKPKQRTARDSVLVEDKTEITVIPTSDGIEFNPPEFTKKWVDPWVRYQFDFSVPEDYPDDEIHIRVSIQIKGIEVAHIKSSCDVIAEAVDATSEPQELADNPLEIARIRGIQESVAELYRQIFLSYSHDDQDIALKRAEEIEKLLGDKVFIDVKSLRAGEDWEVRLAQAIDGADIFHLLWSEHSSKSQYCRYEWDYALKNKCPETRCVGVIRPIYWQDPMPKPPEELAHLHFQKIDVN